jgi:hypothetical protein
VNDYLPVSIEVERERAIQTLCSHYANDHLTTQELELRFERAYKAQTVVELQALTASLPALTIVDEGYRAPARASSSITVEVPEERRHLAVMSELKKRGAWIPARRNLVKVIMGSATIDLREALLGPGVTQFDVSAVMGEVKILVPPGVAVECSGSAFMGEFDDMHTAAVAEPGVPRVDIIGSAFMGSVHVKSRLPGESALEAWRRGLQERRKH